MKRSIRLDRLLLVAIVAVVAAWPLARLAQAGPPAPDVPGGIAVEDGYKVFLVGHAVGVQIYSCSRQHGRLYERGSLHRRLLLLEGAQRLSAATVRRPLPSFYSRLWDGFRCLPR